MIALINETLSFLPQYFVVLPPLFFIIFAVFGRFIGKFGIIVLSFSLWSTLSVNAVITLWTIIRHEFIYSFKLGNWITSNLFIIDWQFTISLITSIMLVIVTLVSLLVHLYSISYMSTDPHFIRFISYLTLFTFFMLLLITGDNLLILFLGWEGVGLCSYLLISFWYTRISANKAALQAMIVNRVSDFIFTLGILYTYYTFGSLSFSIIFTLVPFLHQETIFIWGYEIALLSNCSFLLFVGAMGKSAQIGLHTWLPSAMEGPTPVSALIHAATMVTAGVFLVIRCAPLFEYTPTTLLFITFIGGITTFMAASIGLVQNDIKKIIAYSTCSQLGYMFFIAGLSAYPLSLFHLSNHAFFKALLFLTAGGFIHSLSNEQDTRKFGGFDKILPSVGAISLIGSLALTGYPFLAGFYSKELILEFAFAKYTIPAMTVYLFGVVTAIFTSFYSFRIIFAGFLTTTNASRIRVLMTSESGVVITFVLSFLSIFSILVGYITKDLFIGFGNNIWNTNIYIQPTNNILVDAEYITLGIKFLPLFGTLFALLGLYSIYSNQYFSQVLFRVNKWNNIKSFYLFLNNKWGFDYIYNILINDTILRSGYTFTFKSIDKGFLEWFGPWGLYDLTFMTHTNLNLFQTGYIYKYAIFIFYSFVFILLVLT